MKAMSNEGGHGGPPHRPATGKKKVGRPSLAATLVAQAFQPVRRTGKMTVPLKMSQKHLTFFPLSQGGEVRVRG